MNVLPDELVYLEPVFAQLEALDPDEIDENLDTGTLLDALRGRVRGLTARAANQRLESDRALLAQWLATRPDHPGHFVAAFMDTEGLGGLVKSSKPSPPSKPRKAPGFRLSVKAPAPFQLMEQRGNVVLMGPTGAIVLMPTTVEAQKHSSAQIAALSGVDAEDAVFAQWRGSKSSDAGRAFFWLEASGRHVDVVVDCGGGAMDEAVIASVLSTLDCK
jgi:hypothetical protein